VRASFALALLAFASATALPCGARADTLVDHVNGFTLDGDGRAEHFTGLLIGNDGRIVQVFHGGEKRPGRVDYAVDGKQATLIPGLIAPHVHLMAFALAAITPPALAGTPLPAPRPEDRDLALATIEPQLLSRGITAVADMGTTIEDWQTYRRAGDEGRLAIRIMAYAGGTAAMVLIGGPRPTPWLYDDRLRLNGVFLDGSGGSRDSKGRADDVQLKNLMSRAAMDQFQVAVRVDPPGAVAASGPPALNVNNAIAELSETYKGDRRWRVEAVPAKPPLPEPIAAMAGALDRLAVLRAFTVVAAHDGFAEGRFGRIAVGAREDFVLLDTDLELASAGELRGAKVRETWVGGHRAWAATGTGKQ